MHSMLHVDGTRDKTIIDEHKIEQHESPHMYCNLENFDNEQAVSVNDALSNFFSINVNQLPYTYVLHSPYISSIVGTCSGRF